MKTKTFVGILSVVVLGIVTLITISVFLNTKDATEQSFFTCAHPLYPADFSGWKQEQILKTSQTDIRLFRAPSQEGLVKEVLATLVKLDEEAPVWHLFVYQYTVDEMICFCIPPVPQLSGKTPVMLPGNQNI